MKDKILKAIEACLKENGYTTIQVLMNSGEATGEEKEIVGLIKVRAQK